MIVPFFCNVPAFSIFDYFSGSSTLSRSSTFKELDAFGVDVTFPPIY